MTTGAQKLRLLLRAVLLTLGFALGTAAFGWWAVPLVAVAWGVVGRDTKRPALVAGLSAALAWDALLIWDRLVGPVAPLALKLGQITGLPGIAWVAATVAYPLFIGWAAAEVTGMFWPRSGSAA